jgi:hypothetical protein
MSQPQIKNTFKPAITLEEFGEMLRRGDLSHVNGQITVDLETVTKADFHTLIDIVRHKSFGHDLLRRISYHLEKSDDEMSLIEALRSYNHNGDFQKTLELLMNRDISANYELVLEKARALVFLGRYKDVSDLLHPDVIEKAPVLNTQGVLFQLLGHARLEIGQIEEARSALMRSLDIAKTIGNKAGEISCHLFLSKYSCIKGDFQSSGSELNQTLRLLREIRNFRWLLGYYRTLSHHQFMAGQSACFGTALTGALIARSLQDQNFFLKGILEFLVMQKKFRVDFFSEDPLFNEIINHPDIEKNEDLKRLRELAQTGAIQSETKSVSLIAFEKSLQDYVSYNGEWECPSLKNAINLNWIYDSANGVLLDLGNTLYEFLSADSPLARMITTLNSTQEAIPMPKAFQMIWDIPWQPHRHENTVKVSIGRIGRMCPSVKIRRKSKALSLEQKGLVT